MTMTTAAMTTTAAEKMTTEAESDAVAERLARLQARRSPKNASPDPPVAPGAGATDAESDAVAERLARLQARRSPERVAETRPSYR